jgi:hypothetical protein
MGSLVDAGVDLEIYENYYELFFMCSTDVWTMIESEGIYWQRNNFDKI